MKTEIGFIRREEVLPSKGDVCAECIARGLNACEQDEVCLLRLAQVLGKEIKEIYPSLIEAQKKGLVIIRSVNVGKPRKFIKITEEGKLFFGSGLKGDKG